MPHREKESHERTVKARPRLFSSGKEPVRTVETSAVTPPASWREALSCSEMSWPTPSPTHCMSRKTR